MSAILSAVHRRAAFVAEMGLGPVWLRRDNGREVSVVTDAAKLQAPPTFLEPETGRLSPEKVMLPVSPLTATSTAQIAAMDWSALAATVAECTQCGLCQNRTLAVFGSGDLKAKWLFVGGGPGHDEDLQGEPFVGAAGKLLDNMLAAMGLQRGENAYLANIVKCRLLDASGADRPPTPEEAAACLPYLERQIALIQPSVIVALGKTAAVSLLGLDDDITLAKLRGAIHRYRGLPVIVTYHPAHLLRQLADKSKVWSDLCLAMDTYAEPAS